MSLSNVVKALKSAKLLGTYLIPAHFQPSVAVEVAFPLGGKVQLGNELKVTETQAEPVVRAVPADPAAPSQEFTLALLDPDAPSAEDPKWSPFCHWIQTGMTPLGVKGPHSAHGSSLVEYMGPAPPQGSGFHRYVFLLYREKATSTLDTPKEDRKNFGIAHFVEQNSLELVGANFFKTKVD